MLTSPKTISALSHYLDSLASRPLTILDPVMISTSGHMLLPDDAIDKITSSLLPHVDWITPNIPEALRLINSSQKVTSLSDLLSLADGLGHGLPARTILLKGGHLGVKREELSSVKGFKVIWEEGDEEEETVEVLTLYREHVNVTSASELVVDILIEEGKEPVLFVGKRLESKNTHGTGCTLSSAIASIAALSGGKSIKSDAPLSTGRDNVEITRRAIEYTRTAISTAFAFGKGHGPLNHSHINLARAIPP